jgi:hypothetical protein
VNTEAHGQPDLSFGMLPGIQGLHRPDYPEGGADRSLAIVFVGDWIPEIDENAIAEVLGHVAVKTEDDLRTDLLGTHDLTHVLGIEAFGKRSRPYEVAEHHGELPAFRLRGRRRRRSRLAGGARRLGR